MWIDKRRGRQVVGGVGLVVAVVACIVVTAATARAQAAAYTVLHSFSGADGAAPRAGLIQATDGNFYGTTSSGGANNLGTIVRMSPDGTVTVLHSFAGWPNDGATPQAALLQASDGNIYGTTSAGGAFTLGTVFKMTAEGTVTILHSFTACSDGPPDSNIIQATDGNFYGTSVPSCDGGSVYRLTPEGIHTPLYAFPNYGDRQSKALIHRKSDLVVWRPTEGTWYVRFSSSNFSYATRTSYQWGRPGDTPVAADVDGDGKTDLVIYRPTNGTWYVRFSSSNYSYATWTSFQWGLAGDQPVVADIDNDGKADLVVWRPSEGMWYLRFSVGDYGYQTWTSIQWGLPGDLPM